MEKEAASPSGPSAALAHHPKFPSSFEACPLSQSPVGSRTSYQIPLRNQRTDYSLDLFLESTEINSLPTLENGIILTVSLL